MSTFQVIRLLLSRLWKGYPARCFALFGLGLVRAGTEGLAMILLLPVIQSLGIGSSQGGTLRSVFARVGLAYSIENALLMIAVVAIASALVAFVHERLQRTVLRHFVADLQTQAYESVVNAGLEHLARQRLGEIVAVFSRATNQAGSAVAMIFRTSTVMIITAGLLVVAFGQSAASVLVLMGMVLVLTPFLVWNNRRVSATTREAHETWRKTVGDLADQVRHVGVIRAMGIERQSAKLIRKQVHKVAEVLARQGAESATLRVVFEPLALIFCLAFFYVALTWLLVPVENMVVLMLVLFRLLPNITGILETNNRMPETVRGYAEMVEMMNGMQASQPEMGIQEPPNSLTRPIRFEGVTVVLGGRQVLNHCSLEIPERGLTVIIGSSGAGKSTILSVLLGLQPCRSGSVVVEGVGLTNFALSKWRQRIGYVSQDTPLFNTTLRENLLVAAPDRDDAAITKALSQAGLDALVQRLPHGLDSPVGEQGGNFSGGERQRITLARGLLRDPMMLILDEPTSALDPDTTAFLLDRIVMLARSMPVLIVTHDTSLVEIADRVYVIREGEATRVDADEVAASTPAESRGAKKE